MECGTNMELIGMSCVRLEHYLQKYTYYSHMQNLCQSILWLYLINLIGKKQGT